MLDIMALQTQYDAIASRLLQVETDIESLQTLSTDNANRLV
jgi:hypothetical protein